MENIEMISLRYNKHLLIQFSELVKEGSIVLKSGSGKIIQKYPVQNKSFLLVEVPDTTNPIVVELQDSKQQVLVRKKNIK